jgi:mono/diheme cytochrome c family protein
MRTHFYWLIVTLAALPLLAGIGVAAQGKQTVWDGVYNKEQADRGEKVYQERCSTCHGATLTGGDYAPPLAGEFFNSNWDGLSVSDLFDRIKVTMPQDAPGALSRPQAADVLAFLLSAGKFPAGDMPLSSEAAALGQLKFVALQPAR